MREIGFLHYRPAHSLWHRHDARLKILELILWSIIAFSGNPLSLAILVGILVTLHLAVGRRISDLKRPLIFWLFMAAGMILGSGLSDSGTTRIPIPRLNTFELPMGGDGLLLGAFKSAKLLVVLLAGQFLAATTDPSHLSDAVYRISWFLPKRWRGAVATSIALTLGFIPLIFDESATARDAAFSRGLGLRRSVFRRALALGLPMVEGTLRRADITSEALLSRCISEEPTRSESHLKSVDFLLLLAVVLPPVAAIAFYGNALPRIIQ